jgi:hypothetical protein
MIGLTLAALHTVKNISDQHFSVSKAVQQQFTQWDIPALLQK